MTIGDAFGSLRQIHPGTPKYKPELLAKVADLSERQVETDTVLRCFPPGVPRIGPPAKIVHTTREVVFLYDDYNGSFYRIIPTDKVAPPVMSSRLKDDGIYRPRHKWRFSGDIRAR